MGWTEAKGGAGGLTTTEIRKDDFQPDDSQGPEALGIWIKGVFVKSQDPVRITETLVQLLLQDFNCCWLGEADALFLI